ncbi:hypothetical protein [Ahniella affigens]|nr:hypothetical protein [Ahniella affigens]
MNRKEWIVIVMGALLVAGGGLIVQASMAGGIAPVRSAPPSQAAIDEAALVARGRYLVQISGCNDCHTPGYLSNNGHVPESEWLKGDAFAWSGPWGTTYASNLRLFFHNMDESSWLQHARRFEARPPMPWFNVRAMNDDDLRAIYHYARALGPAGEPAPVALPPGTEAPVPGMVMRLP